VSGLFQEKARAERSEWNEGGMKPTSTRRYHWRRKLVTRVQIPSGALDEKFDARFCGQVYFSYLQLFPYLKNLSPALALTNKNLLPEK
jgi:hypothetical protein